MSNTNFMMADNTFSKSYHLLSASDFSYVRNNSKICQNRWLRVYYSVGSTDRLKLNIHSRIGLAVSKKVGNACIRALSRRVLRETFRQSSYKEGSLDFVVTVSPLLFKKNNKSKAIKILRSSFLSILPRMSVVKD